MTPPTTVRLDRERQRDSSPSSYHSNLYMFSLMKFILSSILLHWPPPLKKQHLGDGGYDWKPVALESDSPGQGIVRKTLHRMSYLLWRLAFQALNQSPLSTSPQPNHPPRSPLLTSPGWTPLLSLYPTYLFLFPQSHPIICSS